MKYEIEDYSGSKPISLMADSPIYEAETGRKALDKYLKEIGFTQKVKVSASSTVHFKVTPIHIDESGRRWIDRRGGKKAMWYAIQPEAII